MEKPSPPISPQRWLRKETLLPFGLAILTCFIYAFSNPTPERLYAYTFEVAWSLLEGELGVRWKALTGNELVPFEGKNYSVFPLGSVLCLLPIAALQKFTQTDAFPARMVFSWVAGVTCLLLWVLTARYQERPLRRLLLTCFLLFGSWYWCNGTYGGAWQIALQFAVLGQIGALVFTLVYRKPLLAGLFFAIGFGNRTEILLTVPFYLYLLCRQDTYRDSNPPPAPLSFGQALRENGRTLFSFCLIPFCLGVATLWYNYARFHTPFDFGYSRIPGVLDEANYRYGIFSLRYIPHNLQAMLWSSSWETSMEYPFLRPDGFGGSVLSACPYLFLLVREGVRDRPLQWCAWGAIALMTFLLWTHGDTGGWQFSYRYAMVLLPWIVVLLLNRPTDRITKMEWFLFTLSILLNAWSCYQFHGNATP